MRTLVGTWALTRFMVRRERIRLSVWVLILALVPVGTASAFQSLYPTAQTRAELAATVASTPALVAMLGPLHDSSIGGLTAWRIGAIGSVLVALMAVLTMIRHTRDEEETGRRELLGSTVIGRHAPLAGAFILTSGAGLLLGLILAIGLVGLGLPTAGSLAFGLGFSAVAMAFAGVGAVAAQLTESGSAARGVAVGAVGLAFMLRVAGDAGESAGLSWMSSLSPIGWFSRVKAFADERWWVFALWLGLAVLLGGLAFLVAARRDVGAGAFPPRAGSARASRSLSSPLGLAWRLQRGSLIGWGLGLAVLGIVYGAAADSVGAMLDQNPQLARILEQLGGEQGLTDTFFSATIGIIALIAAAYAIRSILRMKVEEDATRAEPVLATSVSRVGWAGSHLIFGVAGPVLILALAGFLAGATYGAISGDIAGQVPRVLAVSLVQLPAVWVIAGVGMAIYGLKPSWAPLSWAVLVASLLLGQLGQILEFPQWAIDLSPFSHIPQTPAEQLEILPIAVLCLIALAFLAAGLVGIRSRDIPSA
jgi:polyether ionophore transport system permease protein